MIRATVLATAFAIAGLSGAQAQDLKSLPSGGGLKDVPSSHDLPGVRLNLDGMGTSPSANCTDRYVNRFEPGGGSVRGNLRECNFGNFSISTVTSGQSGGIPGMQQFHGHYHPVPEVYRPGP